jgi:SAM-dependent methyltransferase
MTERLLLQAGIGPHMRVLDAGCGRGDVSIIAARIVDERGEVVGIDSKPELVAAARERAEELELYHATFVEGDFRELGDERGLFDAAVGRRILMHQADPVDAVRRLARSVRPGGPIIFQEVDPTVPPTSLVPLPLHEQVRGWIWQTLERSGTNVQMGFELHGVLEAAGLSTPEVRAEAIVQTPTTHHPSAPLIRMLLPRIVEHGVATEQQVDVETLEQRLLDERAQAGATYIGELVFGAWALVASR